MVDEMMQWLDETRAAYAQGRAILQECGLKEEFDSQGPLYQAKIMKTLIDRASQANYKCPKTLEELIV